MIERVPRILILGIVISLWAQGPDQDHARSNVWIFASQAPGFRVEKVVADKRGRVYVGTPQGLFSLQLSEFVRVPGLPEEAVLDLQLLADGDAGVRFSSGSYAVGFGAPKRLPALPATAPASGNFDWGGFSIQIQPKSLSQSKKPAYDLLVRRKSDSKVLVAVKNSELDQRSFWEPVSREKAIFAVSGHWLLVDSKSGKSEYLSFQLPHRAVDHFVDEQQGRLYMALEGEGLGVVSIRQESSYWNIRPEAANAQLMNGQLWVAQSGGFSRIEKRPYRRDEALLVEPDLGSEAESFLNQPNWMMDDAQEALETKSGVTIAVSRNELPLYRRGSRPWQRIRYQSAEAKELPVRWIAEAADGRVWAAAKHGLFEITGIETEQLRLQRIGTDLGQSYISEFKRVSKFSIFKMWQEEFQQFLLSYCVLVTFLCITTHISQALCNSLDVSHHKF